MDFKKKLRNFFTLTRKANAGFTLVELIVVIAVLAILAGVGSAGYAGYIKAANKGNDKVLVGNIMRAIEMGTNTTMFVNEDSFKMGSLAFPVGFVTLNAEGGAKVITSSTEQYPQTEGNCKLVKLSGLLEVKDKTKNYLCEKQRNIQYKEVTELEDVWYCETHGPAPEIQELSGNYVSGWNHVQGTKTDSCLGEVPSCENGCSTFELTYTEYPAGAKMLSNLDALYLKSNYDPSMCEAAYANQYGVYKDPDIGEALAGDPLYDSLVAAFGEDLSTLKLSFDGWTNNEGIDYATFYSSAPELMGSMETLTGLLVAGQKLAELANKDLGLSQDYENGEQVLIGVSGTIASTYDEAGWENQWQKVADSGTWDSYGFGLSGRENYCAARMAYNNAFASYLTMVDPSIESKYIQEIEEFYTEELFGVGLPGLICTDAFTDSESKLIQNFKNAGDTNAGQEGSVFNTIAEHFATYKSSDACKENGKLVYDTLLTFNETSDIAFSYAEQNGGTIYDYYDSYVNEMAALYDAAWESVQGGIVIIVSVEEGNLNFAVSPSEANPRNS